MSSKIEIDLNSDSRLQQFKGKQSYGYFTHSQSGSTYLDVVMKGGLDASKLFNASDNSVWLNDGVNWYKDTSISIQSELGYVRECTNPETGITYIIKGDEVILK